MTPLTFRAWGILFSYGHGLQYMATLAKPNGDGVPGTVWLAGTKALALYEIERARVSREHTAKGRAVRLKVTAELV